MKNRVFTIVFLLLIIAACNEVRQGSDAVFNGEEKLQWITDSKEEPDRDSMLYLDQPAPLFRTEFSASNKISEVMLHITALGYYTASLNGHRIGRNVLDPAWTDPSKRIYYANYNLTELIIEGENCIGVSLGNGFYNPLPLRMWGHRNLRNDLTVGKPAFIAKLVVSYKDGSKDELLTGKDWKLAYGPILRNSVYLGTVYDAGKELSNWNHPGYDDSEWEEAIYVEGPGGELQEAFFPPVQITREIEPAGISSPEAGVYVVDMGINFTGTYRIKISGDKGDSLIFRFGERLYNNGELNPMTTVCGQIKRNGIGGPGSPDIAEQTDTYIIGAEDAKWFTPEFTFHTYRYMEIRGLEHQPDLADIKGLVIHSNVKDKNDFSSSSQLINDIQDAAERTFLANLVSVQSDCAAREKFGYGGDINASSEAFIYNFDMQDFYRKTVYDWVDAVNDSCFVDTAPFVGIAYCGLSWESAMLTTQYYLYLYYNDIEIIEELYDLNVQWMEKAAELNPEGIVDSGLGDHESLEPVPVELTGTCHYLQCAKIMKTFAGMMEDRERQEKYGKLAEDLRQKIADQFWDMTVDQPINRQTLFASLLYHDVLVETDKERCLDSLLTALREGPSGHFTTGIFGTKFIMEALSRSGHVSTVFDVVNSTNYPGWGHMIDRGATTIWETWQESENTYSNCHPMFGSVSEWFFKWLGGIRPDPEYPGFSSFHLSPNTPEGLEYVNCTYHSPVGQIVSNWHRDHKGNYIYEIKIPDGSSARVNILLDADQTIELETYKDHIKLDETKGGESGKYILEEGHYIITVNAAPI